MKQPSAWSIALRLALIASAAVLVHGYHLGVDDAEIYVPAIKHVADPGLYPFGSEFFASHAGLSLLPDLIGGLARWTHLPVDFCIFSCHVVSVFLLLLAAWELLRACFQRERAWWAGVALLAAAFCVPVAGTALVIMDPYVTARSLSTPLITFAVARFLEGRPWRAAGWLTLTASIHPQMAVYGGAFLICLHLAGRTRPKALPATAFAGIPFLWPVAPARGAAAAALHSRAYFFLSNWAWYEWVGVAAPLALLWRLSRAAPRGTTPQFRRLTGALVPFALLFTAAAVFVSVPTGLENYARLQPMRALHLLYIVLFLALGGLAGEYVVGNKAWRWLALFVPLGGSMWLLAEAAYPHSAHVEWPGGRYSASWPEAFLWIRHHTPKDAVFALTPDYMLRSGDDMHGFRALAERSVLADAVKDSGAVSLFPQLAGDWQQQVDAQTGWDAFQPDRFRELARRYPVTWIVTLLPGPAGMLCPYKNAELAVCRIDTVSRTLLPISRHRDWPEPTAVSAPWELSVK